MLLPPPSALVLRVLARALLLLRLLVASGQDLRRCRRVSDSGLVAAIVARRVDQRVVYRAASGLGFEIWGTCPSAQPLLLVTVLALRWCCWWRWGGLAMMRLPPLLFVCHRSQLRLLPDFLRGQRRSRL